MNVFYAMFLREMGAATRYEEITPDFFEQYANVLPKSYMEFLAEEGWSSYADGLFWTVNPNEYAWVTETWLGGVSGVAADGIHVIARNVYGEFYCVSTTAGCVLKIACPRGLIVAPNSLLKPRPTDLDVAVRTFFATGRRKKFDLVDSTGTPLFDGAHRKLGSASINQVYGFLPPIPLGGDFSLESLEKVRMDVHLDMLRASMEPILQLI